MTLKKVKQIHIVQNVIPSYRRDFFECLGMKKKGIKIFSSKQNELGLNTIKLNGVFCDSSLKLAFYKDKLIFQDFIKPLSGLNEGDILVISGNPRILSNYFIIILARFKKIKIVCWSHGWTAGSHGFLSKCRIKMMRFYDAVLLYTEKEVEIFVDKKLCKKPLYYLNNGLNYERIRTIYDSVPDKEKNDDLIEMIFCGRLTSKSNILMLIRSVKKLGSNFRLTIVGDGELFVECESLISELEIKNVCLIGAIYDEYKLCELYKSSDLFVYPGKVGLSLIHAFSHGLPAVLHDNAEEQMPEYAASNENNTVYFDFYNECSLVNSIMFFSKLSKKKKHQMSLSSIDIVKSKFNTSAMVNNFIKMVDEI